VGTMPVSALTIFTAHPVMGGETCHYTHLTAHCLPSITLEGIRQGPYSAILGIQPYPSDPDPTSTRPRRPAQFDREGRTVWHHAPGHFIDSSSTPPRCPGMVGHSQCTSLQSPQQGSTKYHLKASRRPGLLLPYKRAGRVSTTDRRQRITGKS
jgi:hypothetical protein